jgi:hypothetical protein
MLQHVLHVFIREAEIQQAHSSLDFVLNLLFIEILYVFIEILHADLAEIYLRSLRFLKK